MEIKTLSCLTSKIWGFELTFDLQRSTQVKTCLKAHIIISYLTSIDTFYLEVFFRRSTSKSYIDTFSPSRTVFEIFDFQVFRDWPWPLTFRGYLRSKLFSPFESPFIITYLTSIDTSFRISRYLTSKFFRVWPWPLTFKWHLRSTNFHYSKTHTWLSI